jgi:hypothetical protein
MGENQLWSSAHMITAAEFRHGCCGQGTLVEIRFVGQARIIVPYAVNLPASQVALMTAISML